MPYILMESYQCFREPPASIFSVEEYLMLRESQISLNILWLTTGVIFIVSLGTAAVSHRWSAPARSFCDSCYAQGYGKYCVLTIL